MTKTLTVLIHNKNGCPNELFGGFSDFPHTIRLKLGERVKVEMPITCRLAEFKRLVIKKNKDGDSIPTPYGRRSKYMLKKIEQWRKDIAEDEGNIKYPHADRGRRGVLD